MRRLVGQDRQAAIDLNGVGGHEIGGDTLGDSLGDGGLSARGRAEDGEDVRHPGIVPPVPQRMTLPSLLQRTHRERTRLESLVFVVTSIAIGVATLDAVAWAAGFDRVTARLGDINPIWFLVAFGAEALAYVGYVFAYREVARVEEGPSMTARDIIAAVTAGFGPFVARGGFAVDVHAFQQTGVSDHDVRVRVFGLGALEYALL